MADKDNGREKRRPLDDSGEYEVPAIFSDRAVLIPGSEMIVSVKDENSLRAIRAASSDKSKVLAFIPEVLSSTGVSHQAKATPKEIIGTLGLVEAATNTSNSTAQRVVMKGLWRIRVKKVIEEAAIQMAIFEKVEEDQIEPGSAVSEEGSTLMRKMHDQIEEFTRIVPGVPQAIITRLKQARTPGALADLIAASPNFTQEQRVTILETLNPVKRLKMVTELVDGQLSNLRKAVQTKPISDCETCLELADKAMESGAENRAKIAVEFLNHVVQEHTAEVLEVLAEKYLPIFMTKRSLR